MRALGFDVKKADVLKIMKDYDREASGKITFDDFNEVSKYLWSVLLISPGDRQKASAILLKEVGYYFP